MDINVQVNGQRLFIPTNLKSYAPGSQQFVRFIFDLSSDWDDLTVFAQFTQEENSYNQYLDEDNAVYLPHEIITGQCTMMLYGTGGSGDDTVIGTTNYLVLSVREDRFIGDAESTDISESLYTQLVNKVNNMEASIPAAVDASVPQYVAAWLDEHITQPTTPVVDTSLSVSGAAADAKATGDELSDLKSEITQKVNTSAMSLCDVETVPASANMWNPDAITSGGGILANGNFYADERYCYEKIPVIPGETLYFYDLNQTDPSVQSRWICAYDANNNVVSTAGSNTGVKYFTVPDGIAYLTLSTMLSYNAWFMVLSGQDSAPSAYIPYAEAYDRYVATYPFLKNIDLGAIVVDAPVYETTDTQIANTAGAMLNTGVVRTGGTYDSYQYSQKISVSEGDVIKPEGNSGAYFRWLCAYNGNTVVPSAGLTAGATVYTVPSGIDGIIVTTSISLSVTAVSITHQTGTEERKYPISQKLGKVNWKGNLLSGDSVELLSSNVRFNAVWVFTGHVSTMGKITLAIKTRSGTVKELCSVDATNLYYRLQNGNITNVAHGLTITEDLQIRIDSPFIVNALGGITICSDGVEYKLTATAYGTDMSGVPYLLSTGAVMTECAFSWIPKDIDKPIWVFGDSWVSMYDTRWPYYMVRDGYTNSWMLNGFAGEDTDEAYDSLLNLLTIRKPDYIVWLLGMNNGDSSTAVNAVWKEIYDKLVQLCEDYSIDLILYTVPNTPTINNNFKNAIVRASGYRYIDGAAAVGDDGEGNWFTNFEQSASDHNHTSGRGARALYYRILADFPEIAGNSL